MIFLADIERTLLAHQPISLEVGDHKHAAVSLVLRESDAGVEALFIERVKHSNDPWSGQMAFPGGMVEDHDADARRAAERETAEEVGVDLSKGTYLGRLNDQQGRHRGHDQGIVVCGYVYAVPPLTEVNHNYEVEEVVWVPIDRFLDARYYTTVVHPSVPDENYPGVLVGEKHHQVVWGLTRRFMASFFSTVNIVFEG